MRILIRNRQRHRSLDKSVVRNSAASVLHLLKQKKVELSIVFVGDRKMTELNRKYRGINRSTDVLSFETGIPVVNDESLNVLGDVIINVVRAEEQAAESGMEFYDETRRLLIHGILHLLGFDHETGDSDARAMMRKEREIFNAIKKMDKEH